MIDLIIGIFCILGICYCLWAVFTKKGKAYTQKKRAEYEQLKAERKAEKNQLKSSSVSSTASASHSTESTMVLGSDNDADYDDFVYDGIEEALLGDSPIAHIAYTNDSGEHSYRSIVVRDVFYSDDKDIWYIQAVDIDKNASRTFRLDRISSLECNGKTFYHKREILKMVQELEVWM